MKNNGILKRIIFSPLVFIMILVSGVLSAFTAWYLFIKYGGEWITYKSKENKKSISDVYDVLLENLKQHTNEK